jgi:hypothetical protein
MSALTTGRDETTSCATRKAQYDAVCSWGIPDQAALEWVSAIERRQKAPFVGKTKPSSRTEGGFSQSAKAARITPG